jgi:hypothetical protein
LKKLERVILIGGEKLALSRKICRNTRARKGRSLAERTIFPVKSERDRSLHVTKIPE